MRSHYCKGDSHLNSRYFWHFGKGHEEIYLEWNIGSKTFDLGFSISKAYVSEHTMTFVFAIPPIALYWGFTWDWLENRKWFTKWVKEDKNKIKHMEVYGEPREYFKHAEERQFSLRIFDWTIWGDFYSKTMESNSSDPWWMRWNFSIPDFFLGKYKYETKTLETRNVKIPMPEKNYDAVVKIFLSTWKRPRWLFTKKRIRADIEIPEGIPHPGKGTTSYNCGNDALYGGTYQATNVNDAICEVVKSALWYRLNYPR